MSRVPSFGFKYLKPGVLDMNQPVVAHQASLGGVHSPGSEGLGRSFGVLGALSKPSLGLTWKMLGFHSVKGKIGSMAVTHVLEATTKIAWGRKYTPSVVCLYRFLTDQVKFPWPAPPLNVQKPTLICSFFVVVFFNGELDSMAKRSRMVIPYFHLVKNMFFNFPTCWF